MDRSLPGPAPGLPLRRVRLGAATAFTLDLSVSRPPGVLMIWLFRSSISNSDAMKAARTLFLERPFRGYNPGITVHGTNGGTLKQKGPKVVLRLRRW